MTIRKTTVITKKGDSNLSRLFLIIDCTDIGEKILEGELPPVTKLLNTFAEFSSVLAIPMISLKCVIVADKADVYPIRKIVKNNKYDYVMDIIMGGGDRLDSMALGLEELDKTPIPPNDGDIVLIHSAAWYDVDKDTLVNCFNKILTCDCCAVCTDLVSEAPKEEDVPREVSAPAPSSAPMRPGAAMRPGSAVKPINTPYSPFKKPEAPKAAKTAPAAKLSFGYPQCFKYKVLLDSYVNAIKKGLGGSEDDIALAARIGKRALPVENSPENVKKID